ncbi:hypothetical protein BH24CHL3_BH24CHL3_06070 [soil metagenome]
MPQSIVFGWMKDVRKFGNDFGVIAKQPADVGLNRPVNRFAGELPEHRFHFGIDVKGQTMVDAPDSIANVDQAMTGLAVGIVGDVIEHHDALKRENLAAPERGLVTDIVLRFDVELETSHAVGTIPDHRWGNEVPFQPPAQAVCGVLALVKRAGREIPQWALSGLWFVDAEVVSAAVVFERDGECVVRSPGYEGGSGDLGGSKHLEGGIVIQ